MSKSRIFMFIDPYAFGYRDGIREEERWIPDNIQNQLRVDDILFVEKRREFNKPDFYTASWKSAPRPLRWHHGVNFHIPLDTTRNYTDAHGFFSHIIPFLISRGIAIYMERLPSDIGLVKTFGVFDQRWCSVWSAMMSPEFKPIVYAVNFSSLPEHHRAYWHLTRDSNHNNLSSMSQYRKDYDNLLRPCISLLIVARDESMFIGVQFFFILQSDDCFLDGELMTEFRGRFVCLVHTNAEDFDNTLKRFEKDDRVLQIRHAKEEHRFWHEGKFDGKPFHITQIPWYDAKWRRERLHNDILDVCISFPHLTPYGILFIVDWLPGVVYLKDYVKMKIINSVQRSVMRVLEQRKNK